MKPGMYISGFDLKRSGKNGLETGKRLGGGSGVMTEAVIVAILSLVGTLCGAYFANKKSSALIAYRLEELEKKVNKHNSLIERTYKLEQTEAVLAEKIATLEHFHD